MSVRIIKPGNLKHITYRFTCPKCECIFEADGYDVVSEQSRNANGDVCNQCQLAKCPCCGSFVEGAEKDKIKFPKHGEQFEYNGVKFTALGEEQGGMLAIVSELLEDQIPFDQSSNNNWSTSSLRKYLNGEYFKQFNREDLLPFVSNLISDDGMRTYDAAVDHVFLLSCDLYRKYREYIPHFNNWWWTLTPCTCNPSSVSTVRIVDSSGELSITRANYGYGVASACLFNPKIFE